MPSAWSSQRHAHSIIGYQQSAVLVSSWCHLGAVIHLEVLGSVPLHRIVLDVVNTGNVDVVVAQDACISVTVYDCTPALSRPGTDHCSSMPKSPRSTCSLSNLFQFCIHIFYRLA